MMKKVQEQLLLTLNEPSGKLNLFHLMFPLLLRQLLGYSLSSVHTIAMTKVSPEAVAAIGVASIIYSLTNQLCCCPSSGFSILFSHALGRSDNEEGNLLFSSNLIASVFFSILFGGGLFLLAPRLMQMYQLDTQTFEYAVLYLRIQAIFMFVSALSSCLSTTINCFGKTVFLMLVSFASGFINVGLCLLIVNDAIPFPNKVAGVAFAGIISSFISTLILLALLISMHKVRFMMKCKIKQMKSLWALGFTSQMSGIAWQIAGTITTGMVASLGIAALNTRTYINNLTQYIGLISWSIAPANSIMLGRLLGRRDFARGERLVAQNAKIAITCNTILSVGLLILSKPLLGMFTSDKTIIATGQLILLLDIVIEFFRAGNHIYANSALVCAKDVGYISCINIVSCIINNIFMSWILGIKLGLGLPGMFLAFMLDEVTRSILQCRRWKSGKWKQNFEVLGCE